MQFSKIKNGMTKDDIIDIAGSPLRTEQIAGKEKWAYKYYVGENRDTEVLKQVTFFQGQVISYGEDLAEIERLRQIRESDERRADIHKSAHAAMRKAQNAPVVPEPPPLKKPVLDEDTSHYYQEMSGRHGASESDD